MHIADSGCGGFPGDSTVSSIRKTLLKYYDRHRRDLPWRRESDPYRIWISESMLQQTRVVTVVDRYHDFIATFPDVHALARAPVERVCEAWSGLGYYGRARNLHSAARAIVRAHRGQLPRTAIELATLPGIGRYTAGAIASIAFGERVAALDGNAIRVLSRLLARASSGPAAALRELSAPASVLVRCQRPGDLNQSLMDLGSTICTPRQPHCEACPLRPWCAGFASGNPTRFPGLRPSRVSKPTLAVTFAWLEDPRGVWLEQRPSEGLWAGQWQLPGAEGPRARARLSERLHLKLAARRLARVEHELTHRHVRATVFEAASTRALRHRAGFRRFEAPLSAPVSALARRAIQTVLAARREPCDPPGAAGSRAAPRSVAS